MNRRKLAAIALILAGALLGAGTATASTHAQAAPASPYTYMHS